VINPDEMGVTEEEREAAAEKKRSLVLGTLLHELILEDKKSWHVTDLRTNTNAYKDLKDEVYPKQLIKPREEKELLTMWSAVMKNTLCKNLLKSGGMSEQTVAWDEVIDGQVIECKARLDWLTDSGVIVDLKSSMAVDRNKFNEQIWSYGYDFSAAFYTRGLLSVPEYQGHQVKFLHLVVNKQGWAYLWPLSPTWMRVGQRNVEASLRDLAECLNRQKRGMSPEEAWPDRQEASQLTLLEPKPWYVAQATYNAGRPVSADEEYDDA